MKKLNDVTWYYFGKVREGKMIDVTKLFKQ
jgi:hypothetical protein